jgi:hypothetical protein
MHCYGKRNIRREEEEEEEKIGLKFKEETTFGA